MNRIVYQAKVRSSKDPLGLGRLQVELPGFDASVELPWVRLVNPSASKEGGHVFLPEDDDEVLVLLGAGEADVGSMFVLGGTYHGDHRPSYTNDDGENITKRIRTRSGNELTFTDKEGSEAITLQTKDGEVLVQMDGPAAHITVLGKQKVTVSSDTLVEVTASEVEISGSSKVNVSGSSIEISGSDVTIKGSKVSIN